MSDSYSKWENYYTVAVEQSSTPPWESPEPFTGLIELIEKQPQVLTKGKSCIELGCGTSASAVWLAEKGLITTAVDICPLAIQRAQMSLKNNELVDWVVLDLLSPDALKKVGTYDFVFDMQCFHVLRDANEAHIVSVMCSLLNPGGHLMVVAGALPADTEPSPSSVELFKGPPRLSETEVTAPFTNSGLTVVSIYQSRFNMTSHYTLLPEPPLCWVVLFKKNIA
jgi:SAM-dependent methyltransferase